MFVWNVGTGEVITEISVPEIPLSASWSWDGSRIVLSSKDKKVRVADPRTGNVLHVSRLIIQANELFVMSVWMNYVDC